MHFCKNLCKRVKPERGTRNYRDSLKCAKCETWYIRSLFEGKNYNCPCCGDRLRGNVRFKRGRYEHKRI